MFLLMTLLKVICANWFEIWWWFCKVGLEVISLVILMSRNSIQPFPTEIYKHLSPTWSLFHFQNSWCPQYHLSISILKVRSKQGSYSSEIMNLNDLLRFFPRTKFQEFSSWMWKRTCKILDFQGMVTDIAELWHSMFWMTHIR